MALHQTARADAPADPSQAEYDAIYATMMASARGRWFLTEYARRNRSADTNTVLAAIDRIDAHLRGEAPPPHAPEYLQLGLMAMAGLVAAVENHMAALSTGHETEAGAKPRIGRVVSTLRDLGDCVQVMLDGFANAGVPAATEPEAPAAPRPAPAPLTLVETKAEAVAEPAAEPQFVPFEQDTAPKAVVTAHRLPAVDPLGSKPLRELLPADHPLAELRALTKAELIALFT